MLSEEFLDITPMKRQALLWKQIFATHVSDKGLTSSKYEELSKLNSKNTSNPIRKWVKTWKILH